VTGGVDLVTRKWLAVTRVGKYHDIFENIKISKISWYFQNIMIFLIYIKNIDIFDIFEISLNKSTLTDFLKEASHSFIWTPPLVRGSEGLTHGKFKNSTLSYRWVLAHFWKENWLFSLGLHFFQLSKVGPGPAGTPRFATSIKDVHTGGANCRPNCIMWPMTHGFLPA
jgi:hypothetical protein